MRMPLGLCALAVFVALALGGCTHAHAQSPSASRLLGTWFDSKTGSAYRFIDDSLLLLPQSRADGGNAATYRVIGGDKLDIVVGDVHHVSVIDSITAEKLTLQDPVSGSRQSLLRNLSMTEHVRSLEASALVAVSDFATVTAMPDIVWVAPKPTGKGTEWTGYSPTTLNGYASAWTWSGIRRDSTPARIAGSSSGAGYAFGFWRKVPTAEQIRQFAADTSIEATAGYQHIDVGYSATKAAYPAGTLLYLPGGLVYSLGDGFAIAVGVDNQHQAFIPMTHR